MESDILECIFDGSIKPRDLKLHALESITENFSKERIIGDGGYGTVYRGVLRNGEVAVKRIKNNKTIDETLYQREVISLLNVVFREPLGGHFVNHRNIVRFLGYCSHTEHKAIKFEESGALIFAEVRERLLCFEYINNGSLEKYIADELRGLQWDTRYSIIKGICEGLQYLHVNRHIIHMDLKPANILIDDSMVAKITDFGMSRILEKSQTETTNLYFSPGYTAPEFISSGKMTFKCDVYSLGIIIIELVTGKRSIPDSNNVLRRWSHRWHRSGKETPFRYQQIAKLIDIGLLCQEYDPYKRPFISEIISALNELTRVDRKINNANESTFGLISPYLEDDMLGIEPLVLQFPIELNTLISTSLEITNETNACFAFIIQTTSPLPYCIQPNKHIVAPRSKYSVNITLQTLDHAPQDWQYTGDFIVRSTKVNESLTSKDITVDIFNKEEGKLVDEVNLTIKYKSEIAPLDASLGPLIIKDTRSPQGPQESNVSKIKEESKISSLTSDELIQLDPPELCMPQWPNKQIKFIVNVINTTDFYVAFNRYTVSTDAARDKKSRGAGILPPRGTKRCIIHWTIDDGEPTHDYFVWNHIVTEGVESGDIVGCMVEEESKKLPFVINKVSPCPSNGLIHFDPPELSIPFVPNKQLVFSVNIVNNTDYYVGFHRYHTKTNMGEYYTVPATPVMPPRSTQRLIVKRVPVNEKERDDMHCQDKLLLWCSLVSEAVEGSDDIFKYRNLEACKELPIHYNKTSLCASDELIQFDRPQLSFPFSLNKTVSMFSSFIIINVTDHNVGFNTCLPPETNTGSYTIKPRAGILPPHHTLEIRVGRTPKTEEQEDKRCKDKISLWTGIVTQGVEVSDLLTYESNKNKDMPVFLTKTSVCASEDLIQLDPPQLSFPFSLNKTVCSFKIVNVTNHNVCFNTWVKTSSASYSTEPRAGILQPHSTQVIKVGRTPKKEEREDMQCKDKILVWTGIVTQGVEVSDLVKYGRHDDNKELPVVLTKISSVTSSDELIQLDPPELCMPQWPNRQIIFIVNLINATAYNIAFNRYIISRNAARDKESIEAGILPPRATKRCIIHCNIVDGEPTCDYFVSNRAVAEGVESGDIVGYMIEEESKKFPFIIDKTSVCASEELIQFDRPQLSFPFLQNKLVSMFCAFKIVNVTDHSVGFNIWGQNSNSADYVTEPDAGILLPQSTQAITVIRTLKKEKLEDMQCKDMLSVWTGIVTQGVEASDLVGYDLYEDNKKLPVVLTKLGESSSS